MAAVQGEANYPANHISSRATARDPGYSPEKVLGSSTDRADGFCDWWSVPESELPERHAEQFEHAARNQFARYTPLYARLAASAADDSEVVALTLGMQRGQPAPILLFAVARYLVLNRYPAELPWLGSGGDPLLADRDLYPAFRAFCLDRRCEVLEQVAARRVQTNEVGRSASLLPAFAVACGIAANRPLALIEIGASAGLNLLWDRYAYDYGTVQWGDPAAAVRLRCQLDGPHTPPVPPYPVQVSSRLGIDVHPIDLFDEDAVLWLRALVWAEHTERAQLLYRAIEAARRERPSVIEADAVEVLPSVLARIPDDALPVVCHSFSIYQLRHEDRARLDSTLAEVGASRDLLRISLEGRHGEPPYLDLTAYERGTCRAARLAECDPHGARLKWLGQPA